jgi:hypothetical protein
MPACGGNTAPAALAAALEAFASTGNFRDAVLSAANLGGNSDVVAAACGALAGAHYTASAIPTLWRNSLIKKQLIESVGCSPTRCWSSLADRHGGLSARRTEPAQQTARERSG